MGLLQWTSSTAAPTLVPITLFINGQYQDAAIYMADPVPMALDSGIVYEAFKAGVSQGLFEIREPRQRGRTWVAMGKWTSQAAQAAAAQQRQEQQSATSEEGPPRLRRRPAASDDSNAPSASPASAPPSATASASPAPAPPPPDTDRPILKRGVPEQPEVVTPSTAARPVPAAPKPAAPAKTSPAVPVRELVAISDATNTTSRDLKFPFTGDEQAKWTQQLVQLAERQVAAAQKLPVSAPLPVLADYQFHAFDLDQDNELEMVLTGRLAAQPPQPGSRRTPGQAARPETYIALVARIDLDNNVRRIFSSVTDSDRLDVVGRMQFLDAVDADGDGHGELLFRRIGKDGSSYQVYRAGADQLWKLFDSASQ